MTAEIRQNITILIMRLKIFIAVALVGVFLANVV